MVLLGLLEKIKIYKTGMMDMFFYISDMLFFYYKSISYLISYPHIRHIREYIIRKVLGVHQNKNNKKKYIYVYFRRICGYSDMTAFKPLKLQRLLHIHFLIFADMFFDFSVTNRSDCRV